MIVSVGGCHATWFSARHRWRARHKTSRAIVVAESYPGASPMNIQAARVGALMSDLTMGFFALVVGLEKGSQLAQRRRELTATLNALLILLREWEELPPHN